MSSTTSFLTAVANRRSIYALTKNLSTPTSRILEIVTHALKHTPSPFNVRSARCIVLFGPDHDALWQHAFQVVQDSTPAALNILGPKIKGYEAAAGSVLVFDSTEAFTHLTPRFSAISKQFPEWEEHSSGMHQFIVWTALEEEGLGCNLQHYQPGIVPFVREKYGVPEDWKLKCQLVFGGLQEGVERPVEKEKTWLEESLRVYGA
ncbi:Nitroreductase-like protein [Dendryphion nanum]|uniref:Nitroreductase-like protein n=1 Tax=Dendryphion nanum TaxID=256645 RepID=A0A9P9E2K1_9PLEO|nr:Nitroreductase-like protein [Dendryphion nanum]